MKRHLLATVIAALLLATPAVAQEQAKVDDLAWMAGSWIQTSGAVTTRESWLAPLEGAMGGVNQTSRAGRPARFEFMSIAAEAAGPTFTARLDGQAPTPFVLKPGGKDEAVFENLTHDFPQRVIYRKCGEDLCGRIEGVVKGQPRAIDWRFTRDR